MTVQMRTEPAVPKVQKTLQFHEDLSRLVQTYADRKGTSFQRVVQAAVLQFFFGNFGDPDERWLAAFGQLERGEGDPPLDLSTLPIRFNEREAERLTKKLAMVRQLHASHPPQTSLHEEWRKEQIAGFERAILLCEHQTGMWRTLIEAHGGDTKGLIDLYASTGPDEFIGQQARFEEEHPDD